MVDTHSLVQLSWQVARQFRREDVTLDMWKDHVSDVDYSPVGAYIHLKNNDFAASEPDDRISHGLDACLNNEFIIGSVVYVSKVYISCVEMFLYDQEWPEEILVTDLSEFISGQHV